MKTSTTAVRRFRQRQRANKLLLHVEVDHLDHCDMLIAAGLLKAWDAPHDRAAIEDATARLLKTFAEQE
jgi:hypothetical protein